MILEHVVECTPHSHGPRSGIIGLGAGHCAAGVLVHFIDSTHVDRLAVIGLDLLHQVPVAIVNEQGRQWLSCHICRDQAVLGIVVLRIG